MSLKVYKEIQLIKKLKYSFITSLIIISCASSRKEIDYKIALDRMRNHGAEVSTTESILFELLNVCGTPEFKAVSKIVK